MTSTVLPTYNTVVNALFLVLLSIMMLYMFWHGDKLFCSFVEPFTEFVAKHLFPSFPPNK